MITNCYITSYNDNKFLFHSDQPCQHSSVSRASTWSRTMRQQHNRSQSQVPPMLICKYVDDNGSVAMLTTKTSAGVTPEVNVHTSYMTLPSANKAAHSGFETQRRCHQKSQTGVSETPQKDMCPPKIFLKNIS